MNTLYLNTSFRWNTIWSHSHELTKTLNKSYHILYYEPPRLTTPRSASLYERGRIPKPRGVRYLGTRRIFQTICMAYFLTYLLHSIITFWKHRKHTDAFVTYNVYEWPNFLIARILKIPVLFLFVDEYDKLTTIPWMKPYLRFATTSFLKHADHIVCTAALLADRAKQQNKNVTYLPNAVNLEDVSKKPRKRRKTFTVGFLGSIEPWVDHELLRNAAKRLPDVQFDIVGDGSALETFKRAARGLENITFVGRVPHEQVYSYLATWDLAIIPFHINDVTNSVSPVKLFEYWLLGLPVAASPTTELRQYENILEIPNVDALVRVVQRGRANPAWLQQHGKRGEKLVRTHYNWQKYHNIYKDILRTIIP